jgi:predicted esterase
MTKENRLVDIENYISYLNQVFAKETTEDRVLPPITLLGFSQGAATAVRWLMNAQFKPSRLILWAGLFPPDMDFDKGREVLDTIEVIEVYGKEDHYITESSLQQMEELNVKLGLQPTILKFDGKHELNYEVLQKFI